MIKNAILAFKKNIPSTVLLKSLSKVLSLALVLTNVSRSTKVDSFSDL